ncbi:SDR family oxidoreductase [Maricaulis parjimensis]|uniref:SDR family oxidoreductase n=1 Tax=Maricaulis parjimensis TaxID=144023 RepID=UPI001939776A|nr:NAD(P)H-binding protein [Maricaulis parjimensis]
MKTVSHTHTGLTLVIGASGKTGRRVVQKLEARGLPVRGVSRSTQPAFDWDDPSGWAATLDGVSQVYITYSPDLSMPQAQPAIRRLVREARAAGVTRAVLLSGRGEPDAEACEQIIRGSGLEWTLVRAAWFNQNFCEGEFAPMVEAGELALTHGDMPEPFVDADDIADVVVAALTEAGHDGELYDVTGPRLITLREVAGELAEARGEPLNFIDLPREVFVDGLRNSGLPDEMVQLLDYLFGTVLDGRNAYLGDGVQRALGRAPRDFRDYARETAAKRLQPTAA